jgi:hypothetical protein
MSVDNLTTERAVESESKSRVDTAWDLFQECDDTYKFLVLYATEFEGERTEFKIRDHFTYLDFICQLDNEVANMRDELKARAEDDG